MLIKTADWLDWVTNIESDFHGIPTPATELEIAENKVRSLKNIINSAVTADAAVTTGVLGYLGLKKYRSAKKPGFNMLKKPNKFPWLK